jgi:hypothetical protein
VPLQLQSNGLGEGQQIVEVGAEDRVENIEVEFAVLMNSKVAKADHVLRRRLRIASRA